MQPLCIVVYILCNPAPRGSPFELSLGLRSNSRVLSVSLPLRVSCVVVCPRFALGRLRDSVLGEHMCNKELGELRGSDGVVSQNEYSLL